MDDQSLPYSIWTKMLKPETTASISMAFKALVAGNASPDQQKLAIEFLIKIGCRTNDSDWFPDRDITSFAAGRRFVGMQIIDMINLKVGSIKEG